MRSCHASLRPSTLKSIEGDLRDFGHFLAQEYSELYRLN